MSMNLRLSKSRFHMFSKRRYLERRFRKKDVTGVAFVCMGLRVMESYKVSSNGIDSDDREIHIHFHILNKQDDPFICSLEIDKGYEKRSYNYLVLHEDDMTKHEKAIYLTLRLQQEYK